MFVLSVLSLFADTCGATTYAATSASPPVRARIQCNSNGMYWTQASGQNMHCNAPNISVADVFAMAPFNYGVSIKDRNRAYYVSSNSGNGGAAIIANRNTPDTWEGWLFNQTTDNSWVIRSYVAAKSGSTFLDQNYLSVQNDLTLQANAATLDTATTFNLVPALDVQSTGQPPPAQFVLQSKATNQYFSLSNAVLQGSTSSIYDAETFNSVLISNSSAGLVYAFSSASTNKYWSNEGAGANAVAASRDTADAWERFTVISLQDGSYALIANIDDDYVNLQSDGTLIANGADVVDTAIFYMRAPQVKPCASGDWPVSVTSFPNYTNIRQVSSQNYLTIDTTTGTVLANQPDVNQAAVFIMVQNSADNWSLRDNATDLYVCADNAGSSPLLINRPWHQLWEQFNITLLSSGNYGLRAYDNGKWVTLQANQQLLANETGNCLQTRSEFQFLPIPGLANATIPAEDSTKYPSYVSQGNPADDDVYSPEIMAAMAQNGMANTTSVSSMQRSTNSLSSYTTSSSSSTMRFTPSPTFIWTSSSLDAAVMTSTTSLSLLTPSDSLTLSYEADSTSI
ncbi:protein of unknown function, partial [Taphrina deformans PYCC 5710]